MIRSSLIIGTRAVSQRFFCISFEMAPIFSLCFVVVFLLIFSAARVICSQLRDNGETAPQAVKRVCLYSRINKRYILSRKPKPFLCSPRLDNFRVKGATSICVSGFVVDCASRRIGLQGRLKFISFWSGINAGVLTSVIPKYGFFVFHYGGKGRFVIRDGFSCFCFKFFGQKCCFFFIFVIL